MQLLTHALAGWCGGNLVDTTARERLGCISISLLPDLDGLGLLLGREAYLRWHHVVGHNVLFGIAASAMLMRLGRSHLRIGALYLALFHLHLAMDLVGSGPGWGIAYFWPFSAASFTTSMAWSFRAWQNFAFLVALAICTLWIGFRLKRTPLEVLAPRLNAALIRWVSL